MLESIPLPSEIEPGARPNIPFTTPHERTVSEDYVNYLFSILTPKEHEVFLLRHFGPTEEGMSMQEIGDRLALTPDHVKTILSHARVKLREAVHRDQRTEVSR
jgi:RNA polymerase sigma factor (sigma-70 family)